MSLGNRGLSDPIVGVNQYIFGRKVSQELSPGSGMKATFKIGSGKDDELEEDMNNPLYYNKMGLPSRPSDRDLQQQMSQMNLYGSQQSVDFKRDETWKLSSQLGTSLADPTADLWRSSSSSQMSKANLSASYNLMGVPHSSGRSMGSSSQFSRSLSQPTGDRFNPLSGSSMQTTVSTGFQQSPSSSPTSGQTSPGSRGLLSMGQRGIIGQGLLNSSSSGHQQAGSQGLLSGGLPKQNRPSQYQSGMGSPSRNSPTFLSLGMSQLQQQQQQLPSHSQQPPQRMGSFGSLNSLTSSSGSGPRMMPNVSSQGNFLSPSLQSGSLLSGGHDFQNLAAGSSFDLDFPALANRPSAVASSSTPASQPLPIRTGYGQVVMVAGKAQVEGNQEFQIHSEDFPALPGSQSSDPSVDLKTSGGGTSYEQVLKDGSSFPILSSVDARLPRAPGDKKSRLPGSMGIQTSSSGVITNIPAGMVTDQFGMIGLLTFIRAAETEPNLVTLALGSDLTTLGLNLNSTESLYHTFGSPFSDTTCRPHEIDFHVPQEYMINQFIRDKLAPIKLARYGEDLLFYLYYTNCGDILQLAAAAELYQRDYRYHKEERVWITRAPGMEPQEKTGTYERGTYYYFDPQTWRKVPKEFCVEYDKLEDRPTAQQAVAQHQQQQ